VHALWAGEIAQYVVAQNSRGPAWSCTGEIGLLGSASQSWEMAQAIVAQNSWGPVWNSTEGNRLARFHQSSLGSFEVQPDAIWCVHMVDQSL
jgi:hypothetical protein